jgi:hypothetical protein
VGTTMPPPSPPLLPVLNSQVPFPFSPNFHTQWTPTLTFPKALIPLSHLQVSLVFSFSYVFWASYWMKLGYRFTFLCPLMISNIINVHCLNGCKHLGNFHSYSNTKLAPFPLKPIIYLKLPFLCLWHPSTFHHLG